MVENAALLPAGMSQHLDLLRNLALDLSQLPATDAIQRYTDGKRYRRFSDVTTGETSPLMVPKLLQLRCDI